MRQGPRIPLPGWPESYAPGATEELTASAARGRELAIPRNQMGGSTPICYNRVNSKLLLTRDNADGGEVGVGEKRLSPAPRGNTVKPIRGNKRRRQRSQEGMGSQKTDAGTPYLRADLEGCTAYIFPRGDAPLCRVVVVRGDRTSPHVPPERAPAWADRQADPPRERRARNGSGTPGKGTNGRAGRRGHIPARGTGNGQTGRAGPIFMQSQPDPLLWTPTPRRRRMPPARTAGGHGPFDSDH